MKKLYISFVLSSCLISAFGQTLTGQERKELIQNLKETQKFLQKNVKGLTSEQLNFKSSSESWSIAECIEHIALSESNIFMGLIQNSLKQPGTDELKNQVKLNNDQLFAAITDRSYKVKTQEPFEPTGKFGSADGALKAFLKQRASNIQYIKTTNDDLHHHYFTFPVAALGTVKTVQLFYFMSGHTKRHTLQIEEVKQNSNYPKKA